eukprot:6831561-Pyramimonas_sp.AAC.1
MFNDRNDLGQDIAARTIALRQTTGPLRKTLFKRRAVTTKAKVHYLEAFGYSKLFFNAGAWILNKQRDTNRLTTAH